MTTRRVAVSLILGVATIAAAIKPKHEDYIAVFGPDAAKAEAYYAKMWSAADAAIKPNAGQTALLLHGTATDRVSGDGEFPGGYKIVKLQKGFPNYHWKFVKPGETTGMADDGLVFVNGHFAVFPKPWRISEN